MARKTKAEAALTRDRIVTCARKVFCREGVTNTSLEAIAKEAGVTRGAVYWHFRNKADLFMAVRSQTGSLLRLSEMQDGDPLRRLESGLLEAVRRLQQDPPARETYEVMLWKCEYVGEFSGVRTDLMGAGRLFLQEVKALYTQADQAGLTLPGLNPTLAAQETFSLYAGILKLWLGDSAGQLFRADVEAMISQHIASKRRPSRARHKSH